MAIIGKKVKLIYNPYSGDQQFKNRIHDCIIIFQKAGYETHVFCTVAYGDIEEHIAGMPQGFYDIIAISGGDGTLNIVVNALFQYTHNIPLLIIPSGTANDFTSFFKIPKNTKKAAELINGTPVTCDVGVVNGRYFLNVCAAGILANVSQTVNKDLKESLGNLAYYLAGLGKLADLTPLSVRITNSQKSFEEDIFLLLALNSSGTGGFSNLSPNASTNDGLFDFIIVKAMPVVELAALIFTLLSGEHLNHPNILYFQDNYLKVEALFNNEDYFGTDVDGEVGPRFPIVIENRQHALRVLK